MRSLLVLTLGLWFAAPAAAQSLGETSFDNSGSEDAQEPFLRGLLLLHSFEYVDARDAFREAQAIDPSFAMAYWGEAMTHNHPIWMRQDRDAAHDALARMEANLVAITPRERDYLRTLEFLFGEPGDDTYDKETRDDRYAVAMRALAENHPEDLDAAAFYALSLLGTAHEGRDFTTYMKAAAVAEEVFAENPRHPGAAHYLIHAYDDPVHAPLGLRAARVYDQIAPDASHALHMPSHIYLALGMWNGTRDMNQRSYDAALAATDRRGEALNGHGWHALWWWHYATTQTDQRALADSLVAVAMEHATEQPSRTASANATRLLAQHALAFDDPATIRAWSDPMETTGLSTEAVRLHALGLVALADGDTEAAHAALESLEMQIDEVADPEDVRWYIRAAAMSLSAALHHHEGDPETALVLLQEAAALETAAPLTFGPPAPTVPANESLGYLHLELGDSEAATAAFQASLDRAPNRRQSVDGMARARRSVGG
ncbi:MAG: hypothetical protein AAGI52_00485 [Bacteroidota bacterium]